MALVLTFRAVVEAGETSMILPTSATVSPRFGASRSPSLSASSSHMGEARSVWTGTLWAARWGSSDSSMNGVPDELGDVRPAVEPAASADLDSAHEKLRAQGGAGGVRVGVHPTSVPPAVNPFASNGASSNLNGPWLGPDGSMAAVARALTRISREVEAEMHGWLLLCLQRFRVDGVWERLFGSVHSSSAMSARPVLVASSVPYQDALSSITLPPPSPPPRAGSSQDVLRVDVEAASGGSPFVVVPTPTHASSGALPTPTGATQIRFGSARGGPARLSRGGLRPAADGFGSRSVSTHTPTVDEAALVAALTPSTAMGAGAVPSQSATEPAATAVAAVVTVVATAADTGTATDATSPPSSGLIGLLSRATHAVLPRFGHDTTPAPSSALVADARRPGLGPPPLTPSRSVGARGSNFSTRMSPRTTGRSSSTSGPSATSLSLASSAGSARLESEDGVLGALEREALLDMFGFGELVLVERVLTVPRASADGRAATWVDAWRGLVLELQRRFGAGLVDLSPSLEELRHAVPPRLLQCLLVVDPCDESRVLVLRVERLVDGVARLVVAQWTNEARRPVLTRATASREPVTASQTPRSAAEETDELVGVFFAMLWPRDRLDRAADNRPAALRALLLRRSSLAEAREIIGSSLGLTGEVGDEWRNEG